jgi:hypothetical protein
MAMPNWADAVFDKSTGSVIWWTIASRVKAGPDAE